MQEATISFKARAEKALADPTLKIAIDRTTGTAERKRAVAMTQFPQFELARERGKRIKDHVIANLDHYLLEFERNAIASGAKVHWARTAEEASQIVVTLCREAGAKRVTRVKSMLGEEIGLPHALDEAGIERVETDLAEHIVQLGGDLGCLMNMAGKFKRKGSSVRTFHAAEVLAGMASGPAIGEER